jgi:hypothetical protein
MRRRIPHRTAVLALAFLLAADRPLQCETSLFQEMTRAVQRGESRVRRPHAPPAATVRRGAHARPHCADVRQWAGRAGAAARARCWAAC